MLNAHLLSLQDPRSPPPPEVGPASEAAGHERQPSENHRMPQRTNLDCTGFDPRGLLAVCDEHIHVSRTSHVQFSATESRPRHAA